MRDGGEIVAGGAWIGSVVDEEYDDRPVEVEVQVRRGQFLECADGLDDRVFLREDVDDVSRVQRANGSALCGVLCYYAMGVAAAAAGREEEIWMEEADAVTVSPLGRTISRSRNESQARPYWGER